MQLYKHNREQSFSEMTWWTGKSHDYECNHASESWKYALGYYTQPLLITDREASPLP
jgi:hypothetical protein